MKIVIIGGGASGLMASWLLDQDHDVILFETKNKLGGHAQTVPIRVDGKTVPIDIGFEFFNTTLFPYFYKLLNHLSIPLQSFPLTYTFYTADGKTTLTFPPFRSCSSILKILDPSNLGNMLQFCTCLMKAKKLNASTATICTMKDFANNLFLTQSFKNSFFYPMLASGWGVSSDEFKSFAAYDIFKWVQEIQNGIWSKNWLEIVDGTSTYINTLANQLLKTQIKIDSKISRIVYENSHFKIIESDKSITTCDHLIIATNPQNAALLLKDLPHASSIISTLNQIEYFPATVAIHGDESYMPKNKSDWSITNCKFDGKISALTIYKPWKSTTPIFRSWITHDINALNDENILPQPLYALEHFHHQKVTPAYFKAQKKIAAVQGLHNIWFVGNYTYDIDSHESAIVSALLVAKKLAPDSKRLKTML